MNKMPDQISNQMLDQMPQHPRYRESPVIDQETLVSLWNAKWPVSTPVAMDREVHTGATTGPAFLDRNGCAVVKVSEAVHPVPLEMIRPKGSGTMIALLARLGLARPFLDSLNKGPESPADNISAPHPTRP
jgi:hypothetical protein